MHHEELFQIIKTCFFGIVFLITGTVSVEATTFSIINNDAVGEGFNDISAVAPVAGNPGITVGEQRWNVFVAAAAVWAEILNSDITIVIEATNKQLDCSAFSGVLGRAGPGTAARDFPNAPVANTFYAIALADSLAQSNLYPSISDIETHFNSNVGAPGCLESTTWSYEIPTATLGISFYETVLHEIGHGLGFLSFVDEVTGEKLGGFNDAYSLNLMNETNGLLWANMTNSQRVASAINTGNLTWAGSKATAVSDYLSVGLTNNRIRMYSPNPIEIGSSVSHWDSSLSTALGQDEIMEAFSSANAKKGLLTNMALADTGWVLLADLAITNTNNALTVRQNEIISYNIVVTNRGPGDVTVIDATVVNNFSTQLTEVLWSCQASIHASCAVGIHSGNINDTVTIPLNGTVTYSVNAKVIGAVDSIISNTATVIIPNSGYIDVVTGNNSEIDTDTIQTSDQDQDGIPDDYEVLNGTNPAVDDANDDVDNDGYTNIEEYLAATDPKLDTDGDGLFDQWEIDNGFNLNDSSDCPSWVCIPSQGSWRSILYQSQQ